MRKATLLACALLLIALPGCSAIGDCCEGVGNACGSVWSTCTGVFSGGDDSGGGDALAGAEPIYDSAADAARDEDAVAEAPSTPRGAGAFRMP